MDPLYQTQATAVGGRSGWATSVDGALRVQLARPKTLGGSGECGTNPEQLLAAGYAACFLAAIRRVAEKTGVTITEDSNVTATVALVPQDEQWGLAVRLAVDLPGMTGDEAHAIAEEAQRNCPYSRAVRGNVEVQVSVI